mgnify:CR=1 FL=1
MKILLLVALVLVIYILVFYNIIIKHLNSLKHSKSLIEIYLNQRFDLIPNLIKCVKEYTVYAERLFEKITELRTDYIKNKQLMSAVFLDIELNKTLLFLENYPDLKANEQFLNLQKNLAKMENQIQAARRIYNNDVEKYNNIINIFPNNILAKIFKFKTEMFFQMEEQ